MKGLPPVRFSKNKNPSTPWEKQYPWHWATELRGAGGFKSKKAAMAHFEAVHNPPFPYPDAE